MKTTEKDFKLFKETFLEYQKKFGLIGYEIHCLHEYTKDAYADIAIDQMAKKGTVRFSTKWTGDIKLSDERIKRTAMHECLHLLISRLSWLATCRYVAEPEIKEEDEALVIRLTAILKEYEKMGEERKE